MIKIHEIFSRLIKCDTDNVSIDALPSKSIAITDLGAVSVTTAGTPEPIGSVSIECFRVEITAQAANTGFIYVGGSSAGETNTMSAGDTKELDFGINATIDLANLYINSSVDGEGVEVVYYTAS